MADFAARWTVSQTTDFQHRVLIAAMTVAVQYTSETGETVIVDQKRRALAVRLFEDPSAHMERLAMVLAAKDVPVAADDATVEQWVYNVWDNLAGINADEYAS